MKLEILIEKYVVSLFFLISKLRFYYKYVMHRHRTTISRGIKYNVCICINNITYPRTICVSKGLILGLIRTKNYYNLNHLFFINAI